MHEARFAAIETMERWGSLQPWKGPESNEEPNWISDECDEGREGEFFWSSPVISMGEELRNIFHGGRTNG